MDSFTLLRRIVAGTFLAGFVGIWVWIAVKLFQFDPADQAPKLVPSSAFGWMAGGFAAVFATDQG